MTITHRKSWKTARILSSVLVALCMSLPVASHALGLGRLKVHSSLNQPLNAEIEFTSLTEAELKGLSVGLASRADFTAAGVERPAFLAQIKFNVHRGADGRYVLRFSTPTPIEEPFLHLLLQIDWPGGRLVREYTALIDPPYQVAAKAPAVDPPRAITSAPAPVSGPGPATTPVRSDPAHIGTPVTEALPYAPPPGGDVALSADGWPLAPGETPPKPEATKTKTKSKPKSVVQGRVGPAPAWASAASHTVQRGETLWSITKQVRRDPQVSLEQAALAIYHQNRDAFYDSNMNNIRAGKILQLPARDEVEALSKEQARDAVQAQFDAWQEYKLRLAKAKRTVAVDDATGQAESPPPVDKKPDTVATAKKTETPAAKTKQPDELLKIVRSNLQNEKGANGRTPADPARGGDHEKRALAERAETLEESLVSKQIEQKELSEKIDQVRNQLKREARLIELESQSLAPVPKPEAPKAPVPPAEPVKAEAPKADVATASEAPKAEPANVETAKTEPPKVAEAPKPEVPKKAVPPPPPAAEKGPFDVLSGATGDLLLPIILGVVLLATAVLGFVYLRRRRKAVTEFEESILASQAMTLENATTPDLAGQTGATTPESSILSDISQGSPTNVRTDEVDPVAEAEVYLAYGRDETAEEILKDAIAKHPQRQELKIKLLEIYFHRKDTKAFETLAEEVYAAVGGGKGGKLWERVEDMGSKLSPTNPMFRGATRADAPERAGAAPAVTGAPTEVVPAPTPLAPESALDFDLGAPAVTTEIKKQEPTFDLDFDLGDLKPSMPKKPEPSPAPPSAAKPAATGPDSGLEPLDFGAPTDNLVDFDFDKLDTGAGSGAPAPGARKTPAGAPPADDFPLDLGMDMVTGAVDEKPAATPPSAGAVSTDETQQQRWDEAATKLDLARAYIDMGDAEGARSILDEVMTEGNPEQKKQAQDLTTQIR